MKTGQLIRQGDVLLIRTTAKAVTPEHKEVPRDEHGRLVLAEGESSGHRHLFRAPGVCMLYREGEGDRILTVDGFAGKITQALIADMLAKAAPKA